MPKPRALGTTAATIVSTVTDRLAANQRELFDVALLIFAGNKEAAVERLKPVSDNNTLALQVLQLLRAGEISAAQDLLIDSRIETRGK
jgi:hypothetical protein